MSEPERPDLGRAPAWARHLHDCMHQMQVQQQRDRHDAKNRDMALDGALQLILKTLGSESDDGKSGTGLTGRVIRTEAKVHGYDRLKERAMGALAAMSIAVAILWWLTRQRIAAVFGVEA